MQQTIGFASSLLDHGMIFFKIFSAASMLYSLDTAISHERHMDCTSANLQTALLQSFIILKSHPHPLSMTRK